MVKAEKATVKKSAKQKSVQLTPADYVHLHNHTQYSLLDGLTKIPPLIDFVKSSGMVAVAKTDHGTLSGTIEFYKEANSGGVKPIVGIETYVAARAITDRDPTKDKNIFHLTLLAMNNIGYQNLMRLSTIANLDGVYYKPRLDHSLLEKYNEGIIALSGCIGGEIGDALRQGQAKSATELAKWYKSVFGDRFYLELQDHGHPSHPSHWIEQQRVNEALISLGKELGIDCVLTCDAHYLRHGDQEAHEVLLCVQTASFMSDQKRMSLKDYELHVTDPQEIINRWGKSNPEIIKNTRKIADRCEISIELGKILIPKYPLPKGETEKSHLVDMTFKGLARRYLGELEPKGDEKSIKKRLPKEVVKRAEYELSVISEMGFNGYFLIVQDFINWGKDRGIVFGPGRGSAAGSIVSYALRITEIEPLKYNLMFERFLNPGRISMPDIDIDIQDTRRDEVIRYCVEKYGSDRVANIVTYGRMAARNAVRDVARVLQVPYADADRLAKMIPPPIQGRHIPLEKSLKEVPELKTEYSQNQTAKRVFDLAVQLEGTIRSHGVHAAGVVIAPTDIVEYVPLEMAQKGVIATQYPMGPVEELGLLKMDFLGLSNLTSINNALRIIRKVYKKPLQLNEIPLDDDQALALFARGETTGVFQFESAGMRKFLADLNPTKFEDIIACVALYRPGPMKEFPNFIKGKNNPSAIVYLHESLEPVLKETYGAIVYQEQIIQLLQLVAGYSPGEADLVRKAIGKKKREIMRAEEPKFMAGCQKQGLTKSQAEKLWALIQPFADYSFNKAHATCYAQIAYWTAYLKAHYPTAFMAALLTGDQGDTDRLAIDISECRHMGIEVLSPDINESFLEFAVVPGKDQKIRFGLGAIKNVGVGAVEEILQSRVSGGAFKDLPDFLSRVNSRAINRKVMDSLVRAGVFDSFADRSLLLHNMDAVLAYATRLIKQSESGQTDIFGNDTAGDADVKVTLRLEPATQVHDSHERLMWERELLGLYLSEQPLSAFEQYLEEKTWPLNKLQPSHDGLDVTIGGSVVSLREIVTKNGQKMAFVRLEDKFGEVEVILFPKGYQKTADVWQLDRVVLVKGKVSAKDKTGEALGSIKVLVDSANEITLDQAKKFKPTGNKFAMVGATNSSSTVAGEGPSVLGVDNTSPKRVYIRLQSSGDNETLVNLKQTIDERSGTEEVVLVTGPASAKQIIRLPSRVSADEATLSLLKGLVGTENVMFK